MAGPFDVEAVAEIEGRRDAAALDLVDDRPVVDTVNRDFAAVAFIVEAPAVFADIGDADGVPVGTTKPRIPSSVWAQMIATSATEPLVIHIFDPFRIQSALSPSPSRRALVRILAGSEPWSGSVRPKHPMDSPAAIAGSHCCLCSAVPCSQMANIAKDPWTLTRERMPESEASSSRQARP